MLERFVHFLNGIPKEIIIFLLSMLPISELRGAIPVGVSVFGIGIFKTFLISLAGNLCFIVPLLWFLKNLHLYFIKIPFYNKFSSWWFSKVKQKTKKIEKYEYFGLMLFVAIPLPVTGAWSGCVASYLLGLNFWKSALFISFGVIIAGIIVTISTVGITQIFNFIY